jgi:membrane fusion protein (multidrug efflux system)
MNALSPGRTLADELLQAAERAQSRSFWRRRFAIAVLCAAGLVAGAYFGAEWWRHGRFIETTDDAYVGGDVTAISPHVAGFVSEILVADNAPVKAQQALARIDASDYRAASDRAEAAVAAATASLQSLRAQRTVQIASIRQSEADYSAKTARAAFTRLDGVRYATLSVTRSGSVQDAQRAHAADEEAQAGRASSQAALAASRAQIDVLDAQIRQAEAAIARDQADLRRARLDLGYTEIRSPVDGFVANRAVRPGAYVSAGTYLFSIVPAGGFGWMRISRKTSWPR